jgi:hypothetical protein
MEERKEKLAEKCFFNVSLNFLAELENKRKFFIHLEVFESRSCAVIQ